VFPFPPVSAPVLPALGPESGQSAPAIADGSLRRLDPRYVPCARSAGLVGAGAIAIIGPVGLLGYRLGADPSGLRLALLAASWLVVLLSALFCAWAFPPLKFRHLSWRLSSTGLEIRRGVCFRHRISVPRARVQHTDVTRGPLERRFGLATLIVHTAGSADNQIPLEGLEHQVALGVRDFLLGGGSRDGS